MEKYRKILFNVLFNIAETSIIILMDIMIQIPINSIILTILTFIICRACFGNPLHFKDWYRCLIWSTLIMLGLFVILKVELILSILFAIFNALIMTGRTNISDMYLWKGKNDPSKYQDVINFITYNEYNDKLLEFEKKLKERDNLEFLIYKYKFKDGKSFGKILELLNNCIEPPELVRQLDKITFALRLYCGI